MAQITIEGETYDAVRFCALECFADTLTTKVLCHDAGTENVHMGDNYVLEDDTKRVMARWRVERCTSFGDDVKDVYWIIHQATGKTHHLDRRR